MIQKKSLIKDLKTMKKANVAASPVSPAKNEGVSTRKAHRRVDLRRTSNVWKMHQ